MSGEMIPYTFSTEVLPSATGGNLLGEGQYQAVHFAVPADQLGWYLEKMELWFAESDEVILVASGISMEGEGFIVMEWEECEVNPLFLKILESEESVSDVCVYIRSEEVE